MSNINLSRDHGDQGGKKYGQDNQALAVNLLLFKW